MITDLDAVRDLVASFPSRITTRRFISTAKTLLVEMADELEDLRDQLAAHTEGRPDLSVQDES